MMKITSEILYKLYPATPKARVDELITPLNKVAEKYDISTENRLAAFIAQVGHESGGFVYMAENLNYSAKGLLSVFKKYFPTEVVANSYARQPRKIASKVYANRMGNGTEDSGDGWKYRGRGFMQVTGKTNYTSFAKDMGMEIDDVLIYLETIEGAMMSAGWFWNKNKLNQYADSGNFTKITQIINGGQNGAADRLAHYQKAKVLL